MKYLIQYDAALQKDLKGHVQWKNYLSGLGIDRANFWYVREMRKLGLIAVIKKVW